MRKSTPDRRSISLSGSDPPKRRSPRAARGCPISTWIYQLRENGDRLLPAAELRVGRVGDADLRLSAGLVDDDRQDFGRLAVLTGDLDRHGHSATPGAPAPCRRRSVADPRSAARVWRRILLGESLVPKQPRPNKPRRPHARDAGLLAHHLLYRQPSRRLDVRGYPSTSVHRNSLRLQVADAPTRIRTWGLLLRRESLYPAELSGPAQSVPLRLHGSHKPSPSWTPWVSSSTAGRHSGASAR